MLFLSDHSTHIQSKTCFAFLVTNLKVHNLPMTPQSHPAPCLCLGLKGPEIATVPGNESFSGFEDSVPSSPTSPLPVGLARRTSAEDIVGLNIKEMALQAFDDSTPEFTQGFDSTTIPTLRSKKEQKAWEKKEKARLKAEATKKRRASLNPTTTVNPAYIGVPGQTRLVIETANLTEEDETLKTKYNGVDGTIRAQFPQRDGANITLDWIEPEGGRKAVLRASRGGAKHDLRWTLGVILPEPFEKSEFDILRYTDEEWVRKIKLVIFDFDKTITKQHTGGVVRWRSGGRKVLPEKATQEYIDLNFAHKEFFTWVVPLIRGYGVKVAIASFGEEEEDTALSGVQLVRKYLDTCFGSAASVQLIPDNMIAMWHPSTRGQIADELGKTAHIEELAMAASTKSGADPIVMNQIALFDDDKNNIKIALKKGVSAFHCDAHHHETVAKPSGFQPKIWRDFVARSGDVHMPDEDKRKLHEHVETSPVEIEENRYSHIKIAWYNFPRPFFSSLTPTQSCFHVI